MLIKNKLVRFAHNWNNGMLEYWNDGFKEISIQNVYDFIDFLVLMAYFSGKNQKTDAW
jgi:hypothetical protein